MAVRRRPVLLEQSSHGFHQARWFTCPSWRALRGRFVGARALAFFPPQVLLSCRYCNSSGCAPKSVETRKSPSYLARRLATARLQLAAAMLTRIRITQRCARGGFAPTPALWRAPSSYRPVRAMAVRMCSKCCQLLRAFLVRALFVRGMIHPYIFSELIEAEGGTSLLSRRAGSSGISWRILSPW